MWLACTKPCAPSPTSQQLGVVTITCHSSQHSGESAVQGHPRLQCEFQASQNCSVRLCLKQINPNPGVPEQGWGGLCSHFPFLLLTRRTLQNVPGCPDRLGQAYIFHQSLSTSWSMQVCCVQWHRWNPQNRPLCHAAIVTVSSQHTASAMSSQTFASSEY